MSKIVYLQYSPSPPETVFACSYGTHIEYLKQKKNKGQQSRDTAPLSRPSPRFEHAAAPLVLAKLNSDW